MTRNARNALKVHFGGMHDVAHERMWWRAQSCAVDGGRGRSDTPVLRFNGIFHEEGVAHVVVGHNVLDGEEVHAVDGHSTVVCLMYGTSFDVAAMHLTQQQPVGH
jgi:hypothetical protein